MSSVRRGGFFGWAVILALVGAPGCRGVSESDRTEDGDDNEEPGGDFGSYCSRVTSKLNGCGLGPLVDASDCIEPDRAEERCYGECFIDSTCQELEDVLCQSDISPRLEACIIGCEPPPFSCDGGQTMLPDYYRCDGFPDCNDGTDETSCPMFRCASGETVPDEYECDGFPDCIDGTDETGCPAFRCANGETVPEDYECDGVADCSDGSDEHPNCPGTLTCADGSVTVGERCDGYFDCFDQSDEPASCPPDPRDEICGP